MGFGFSAVWRFNRIALGFPRQDMVSYIQVDPAGNKLVQAWLDGGVLQSAEV
jgi:hypothetical protein